jgi:putative phosphoribosyl transferase
VVLVCKLRARPPSTRNVFDTERDRLVHGHDLCILAAVREEEQNVSASQSIAIRIPVALVAVDGDLRVPHEAGGVVIFAHGSGSSRFSKRNRDVAAYLEEHGFATLLLDLLTRDEDAIDQHTREFRFDIGRLSQRVVAAVDWVDRIPEIAGMPVCCFGASTGAAAALAAAAVRPERVQAVVSRGGRPDLANDALPLVQAPTLLIVGGLDTEVLELNHQAMRRMTAPTQIAVVRGASHLFEEAGALDEVCRLAADWCEQHLRAPKSGDAPARQEPQAT